MNETAGWISIVDYVNGYIPVRDERYAMRVGINGYQGKIYCYAVVWLMSRYSVGH